MKYRVATVFLAFSNAVAAAPIVTGEAEVEWHSRPHDKVIVGDTIWRCEGTLCRGQLVDSPATLIRSCLKLANQAERVVAFRTPAGSWRRRVSLAAIESTEVQAARVSGGADEHSRRSPAALAAASA
jgi:hypothetical protein